MPRVDKSNGDAGQKTVNAALAIIRKRDGMAAADAAAAQMIFAATAILAHDLGITRAAGVLIAAAAAMEQPPCAG